jgi:hypothetical protein
LSGSLWRAKESTGEHRRAQKSTGEHSSILEVAIIFISLVKTNFLL